MAPATLPARLPVRLPATLIVCTTCRAVDEAPHDGPREGARLWEAMVALGEGALGVNLRAQECLSACKRGCAVALTGAGRWTYVHGALHPDRDVADLAAMARAYAGTSDGLVPWRARPEVLRRNTLARVPPLLSEIPPSNASPSDAPPSNASGDSDVA